MVEQNCAYQELDGKDASALHLIAWSDGEVAAYLRVLQPPALGRVMTSKKFRRLGLGRELMQRALQHLDASGAAEVRISAQTYLEKFYRSFGFEPESEPYLEDGIPHVGMRRVSAGQKKGS